MNPTSEPTSILFTTKGQIVIPALLRKQFHIEDGTRVVVQATPEGILLKPVMAALVKRGRGLLKSASPASNAAAERAAHKKAEIEFEERHARQGAR